MRTNLRAVATYREQIRAHFNATIRLFLSFTPGWTIASLP